MEVDVTKEFLKYLRQEKPEALWHYTSFDAINNIVKESGKLSFWVSEINFLNDHQEYFHGLKILKRVFNQFKNENKDIIIITHGNLIGILLKFFFKIL